MTKHMIRGYITRFKHRQLELPGEEELNSRGVSYCTVWCSLCGIVSDWWWRFNTKKTLFLTRLLRLYHCSTVVTNLCPKVLQDPLRWKSALSELWWKIKRWKQSRINVFWEMWKQVDDRASPSQCLYILVWTLLEILLKLNIKIVSRLDYWQIATWGSRRHATD